MPANLLEAEITIYAAIGHAQTTWAELENELCLVFRETVSPAAHEPSGAMSALSPAEDAFWSIVSFEGKLNMTDAAVERLLGQYSQSEHPALLNEWTRVSKRVGEKSRKRNKLAHGAIWREVKGDTLFVAFAPSFNKEMVGRRVSFGAPGVRAMIMSGPPNELLSAQQIDAIRKGFDAGILRLRRFYSALQAHNRAVYEREVAKRLFFEQARQQFQTAANNPKPPQP